MTLDQIRQLFECIGGLGMFLYGMNLMSEGLKKHAGNHMKKFLNRMTGNPFSGLCSGALITAVIQSSSAATVMVVGFVNAGLLSLSQSAPVIMGANIGTTATAWMISMSEWGQILRPDFFAPVFLGIGAFLLMFAKKERLRTGGSILAGFGLLFMGLSFLSGAASLYQDSPAFPELFAVLGKNPLLGVLAGMAVTALIQSSSASIGILQTLAMNSSITWSLAVSVTLGQNIGTCVTAMLAAAGSGKTAKQAALIHLFFNVAGAACFGAILFFLFTIGREWAASSISATQISVFHTVFNLGTALLLFPFSEKLVKLSERIVR